MLRRILLLAGLLSLALVLTGTTTVLGLAEIGPFQPGQDLYGVQHLAEQGRLQLTLDPVQRANFTLDLVERRIADVQEIQSAEAVEALGAAFEQAVSELEQTPEDSWPQLRSRIIQQVSLTQTVLAGLELEPSQDLLAYVTQLTKAVNTRDIPLDQLAAYIDLVHPLKAGAGDPLALPANENGDLLPIQQPTADPARSNHIIPLNGIHGTLECSACHGTGTPGVAVPQCITCHVSEKPAGHYTDNCSQCHGTDKWENARFEHPVLGSPACASCHLAIRPPNHFPGQCSQCHTTTRWIITDFDHNGATDCQSCHNSTRPANHFAGQCSLCHNTAGWRGAKPPHDGTENCISCHAGDRPANHSSAQCSQCHNTSGWRGAKPAHDGTEDCISCHAGDRPAIHSSAQCSQCHSPGGWRGASFNHNGGGDCASCHAGIRPANHSSGQCSQCHSPGSWDDGNDDQADDDHDGVGTDSPGDGGADGSLEVDSDD